MSPKMIRHGNEGNNSRSLKHTKSAEKGYSAPNELPPLQLGKTATVSFCITAAHCHQSTNFPYGPRIINKVGYGLYFHVLSDS
jgi:hypothetical protein